MGSGMSSFRHRWPRRFVFDPMKGMIPLLGLQVALEYGPEGSARPPVTAALLATNVLIFIRPGVLNNILPRASDVALNPQLFLKFLLWENFFMSPFFHKNELHLFSNMTSLLWAGRELETSMGSAEFASMVATLLGLSQGITVVLAKSIFLLGDSIGYYDHHVVGFSGVVFGMKAVLTACPNYFIWMGGMVIPAKYAVWIELFITQALVRDTSFLCHLGGLLAGHVYLWLKRSFKGQDPLTLLISGITRVVNSRVRFAQKLLRSLLPQGHVTGRGRVGCHASARESPRGLWTCSTCTGYNSLATDVCERCSTMREDRSFPQRQLSIEEIRRRRLDRLDR